MTGTLITMLLWSCATPLGSKGADTGAELGSSDLSPIGTECDDGGVLDCELECWVADARAYIGDGECDDGDRGPVFDCTEMNFDDGDCEDSGGSDDGTGGSDDGSGSGSGDGSGSGSGDGSGSGSGDGSGSDSGDGSGSGSGSGDGSGSDSGDGSGSDDGGGTGVDGAGDSCEIVGGLRIEDETGAVILELPAGSAGQLDCSGECIAIQSIEGFESGGLMYTGSLGNGICDDGTGPAEYINPDYNCAAWEYDNGDCS